MSACRFTLARGKWRGQCNTVGGVPCQHGKRMAKLNFNGKGVFMFTNKIFTRDFLILIVLVGIMFWYLYAQQYFPVYGIVAMLFSFATLPYVYKVIKHVASKR